MRRFKIIRVKFGTRTFYEISEQKNFLWIKYWSTVKETVYEGMTKRDQVSVVRPRQFSSLNDAEWWIRRETSPYPIRIEDIMKEIVV